MVDDADYGYTERPSTSSDRLVPEDEPKSRTRGPSREEPRKSGQQMKEGVRRVIRDRQNPPVKQVEIGKLGDGVADWGIAVWDSNGNLILSATGTQLTLSSSSGQFEIDFTATQLEVQDSNGTTRVLIGNVTGGGVWGIRVFDASGTLIMDETGQLGTTATDSQGRAVDEMLKKPNRSDPDDLDSVPDGSTYDRLDQAYSGGNNRPEIVRDTSQGRDVDGGEVFAKPGAGDPDDARSVPVRGGWTAVQNASFVPRTNVFFLSSSNDYAAIEKLSYSTSSAISRMTVAAWIRTATTARQQIASFDASEY